MKAKLIFDLDNPNDREDFDSYNQHSKLRGFCFELLINFRKKLMFKYKDDDLIQSVFEDINNLKNEYGIDENLL